VALVAQNPFVLKLGSMPTLAPAAPRRLRAAVAALCALAGATSCNAQGFLGAMPDVVNASPNRTMRRDILAFGTGTICKELMKRTVPLKLNPDDPSLGRFFPKQCAVKVLPDDNLHVTLAGSGYAWSNLTKRVGFSVSASITYDQDFRLDGSTAYVYFRPAVIADRRFQPLMVEEATMPSSPLSALLPGGSPQGFVDQVGQGLLDFELSEGFTVVRGSDGIASVALGMVEPGDKPIQPYDKSGSNILYTNERVELHQGQRDFFGPIEVPKDGMGIHLTLMLEGAPQIDVQIHGQQVGEPWVTQYIASKDALAPPAPPIMEDVVPLTPQNGQPYRKGVKLPRGFYYVVLDHTANAGASAPPQIAGDDRIALVGVGIEVGATN
jgi:hypothetical protein